VAIDRDEQEDRSRYDERRERMARDDRSRGERGFFERAGDEISSWFGDDEAERRREMDERRGRADWRDRQHEGRFRYTSADEHGPRYRDESARRPYSGRPERSDFGRPMGNREMGRRSDMDRDQDYRPMTGDYGRSASDGTERDVPYDRAGGVAATGATAVHDRHYGEWRQRQIDEIDRDYDEYRREHQAKFESDFSNWRSTRQAKRQMLGSIQERMQVFGSDEQPVGTVDKVRGDRVILTKSEVDAQHHTINCAMIDRVDGDRVYLDKTAEEAKAAFGSDERDRALYERDDQREPGAHILNRSFSGTY
jgi:hypothetical protein